MTNKRTVLALVAIFLGSLSGCASRQPCCQVEKITSIGATKVAETIPLSPSCSFPGCDDASFQTTKLLAVGYGAPGAYSQYTPGQQQLMAMRAAQVDAYRHLAEQVYGFRVWGNTAVSAFVTQNDSVRTYVDAFIRGARVVNMTSIANGNYEATVELEISRNFLDCLGRQGRCPLPPASVPGCVSAGCTVPSVNYISN